MCIFLLICFIIQCYCYEPTYAIVEIIKFQPWPQNSNPVDPNITKPDYQIDHHNEIYTRYNGIILSQSNWTQLPRNRIDPLQCPSNLKPINQSVKLHCVASISSLSSSTNFPRRRMGSSSHKPRLNTTLLRRLLCFPPIQIVLSFSHSVCKRSIKHKINNPLNNYQIAVKTVILYENHNNFGVYEPILRHHTPNNHYET